MDNDRLFKVYDKNGTEHEMMILFTTELEQFNRQYVFFVDPNKDEGVMVATYTENEDGSGSLGLVESEEEWEQLEIILKQYNDEMNNCSCQNCSGDCNGECDNDCSSCSCEKN